MKNVRKIVSFSVFTYLLPGLNVLAQTTNIFISDQYRAVHWNADDSLPSTNTNTMLKDVNGFLWIGSAHGAQLCRFDGTYFKSYPVDKAKLGFINSGIIYSFQEDSLHNIWMGTERGLSRYDIKADAFTNFSPTLMGEHAWRMDPFWSTKDEVFCLEPEGIISAFNIHTLTRRTLVQLSEKDDSGLHWNSNKSFYENNSNSIWMLSHKEHNGRLQQVFLDGRVLYYKWPCYNNAAHKHVDFESQPRHNAEDMKYDPKSNSVWINSGEGLLRFSLSDKQFHHIDAFNKITNLKNYDRGVGIDLDRDGRVWLGTYTMGIFVYDPNTDQVRPLFTDPYVQQNVGSDNLHLYCDPDGITWVSNWNGKGLYELLPFNRLVKRYHANPSNKDSLSSGMISTIVRGPQGKLWIGTSDGLNIFDPITEKFEVWRAKDLPGLRGTAIIPLYIDTLHHTAWLNAGSQETFQKYFGMQMYEMDLRTMQCRPVVFKIDTLQLDKFVVSHTLIRPHQDGIIFPEERSSTVFELKRGNLVANPLFLAKSPTGYGDMVPVENRYIFLQHGGRLPNSTYEKIDGKWTKIPHHLDSLNWTHILYLAKDKSYWVSFRDELVHYDKDFTRIKSFNKRDGYNALALNMEFDDDGNLWYLSDTKKISRLNTRTDIITTLSEKDGFREQDNYWFAPLTKDATGSMYFGIGWKTGLGDPGWGLDRVYPERYAATNKARVYVSALTINQKPFPFSGINVTQELTLNYKQNRIRIEAGIIDFYAQTKGKIRYRLEKYDRTADWQYPMDNIIRYEDLQPGSYTLSIQAANASGEYIGAVKKIFIQITPPIWQTWWFRVVATLALLGVLVWARGNIIKRERLKSLAKAEREREHFELEKVKEVDRVKSAFFTNISHEFRTPLTLIKGPVENMLETHANHPKTVEQLKIVQRNSDLLLKLINQLLDLAKLESGILTVEKNKVDLSSFLAVTISSFSSLALQKNIELTYEIGNTGYIVSVDKDKLETILINLINNAIKFTPAGGSVAVRAEVIIPQVSTEFQSSGTPLRRRGVGGEVLITVSDNGIGIPSDQQEKIFERFHQVSEAHKEVGTGIGLSLVKELIELMGGKISVSSQPGKGSEFNVTLPIELIGAIETVEEVLSDSLELKSNGAERTTRKEDHSDGVSAKPHVLVVEDNADLRKFIIDSLDQDYHFLEAADGKQGLEVALENIPDLIVSDVMMPEMDGITMADKLRKDTRSSHIPLILLTAKTSDESKISGLRTGADDYLTKPFNKHELLLKVRNIIARQIRLREKIRMALLKESPKVEVQSADEKFLLKVKEIILARLNDEQLSVESLAEEIALSRSQLLRKITALTGVSVNELIRTFRLQRAAQLLEQNWGPVTQVAYEVGFANLSYFSKAFKEKYGVAPSEYGAKIQ